MNKPQGATKLTPHTPTTYKRIPWQVCNKCGLVYLKNEPTRKRIKQGCWEFADEGKS